MTLGRKISLAILTLAWVGTPFWMLYLKLTDPEFRWLRWWILALLAIFYFAITYGIWAPFIRKRRRE